MKILFQVLLSSSLFFYSCSQATKENVREESSNTQTAVTPLPTTVTPPVAAPVNTPPPNININPANGTSSAIALNPAHGMPGHRCDIQVGQPLNSAPAPAPQTQLGPVKTNQPTTTLPTLPASTRLNPPHGQPGHDCAVAVGAPLK